MNYDKINYNNSATPHIVNIMLYSDNILMAGRFSAVQKTIKHIFSECVNLNSIDTFCNK